MQHYTAPSTTSQPEKRASWATLVQAQPASAAADVSVSWIDSQTALQLNAVCYWELDLVRNTPYLTATKRDSVGSEEKVESERRHGDDARFRCSIQPACEFMLYISSRTLQFCTIVHIEQVERQLAASSTCFVKWRRLLDSVTYCRGSTNQPQGGPPSVTCNTALLQYPYITRNKCNT